MTASCLLDCEIHATPAEGEREDARRPRVPSQRRRRRRQMRGRRSKRWSVRRARLAGRVKQPGERGFRTRESFDGRVEAKFPAFRILEMNAIAVAHFLRQ